MLGLTKTGLTGGVDDGVHRKMRKLAPSPYGSEPTPNDEDDEEPSVFKIEVWNETRSERKSKVVAWLYRGVPTDLDSASWR
jgi:hypothetical protein